MMRPADHLLDEDWEYDLREGWESLVMVFFARACLTEFVRSNAEDFVYLHLILFNDDFKY